MDGAAILLIIMLVVAVLLGVVLARVRGLGKEVDTLRQQMAMLGGVTGTAPAVNVADVLTPEIIKQLGSISK